MATLLVTGPFRNKKIQNDQTPTLLSLELNEERLDTILLCTNFYRP
jgi:hypothetical protein